MFLNRLLFVNFLWKITSLNYFSEDVLYHPNTYDRKTEHDVNLKNDIIIYFIFKDTQSVKKMLITSLQHFTLTLKKTQQNSNQFDLKSLNKTYLSTRLIVDLTAFFFNFSPIWINQLIFVKIIQYRLRSFGS